MRDPWRLGKQFRSVLEMQEWKLPPSVEAPDDESLPQWAEGLILVFILVIVAVLIGYGLLHPAWTG